MAKGLRVVLANEPSRYSRFLASGTRGFETQLDLMVSTVRTELEASRQGNIVICDRSLLDVMAYTRALGKPASQFESDISSAMTGFIENYIRTYEVIFKTCWVFDMADSDDPVRAPGAEFQARIDREIQNAISEMNVPVVNLTDHANAVDEIERNILLALMPKKNREPQVIPDSGCID